METETVYRCLAGIDVQKKMLAVVIRKEKAGQMSYVPVPASQNLGARQGVPSRGLSHDR